MEGEGEGQVEGARNGQQGQTGVISLCVLENGDADKG